MVPELGRYCDCASIWYMWIFVEENVTSRSFVFQVKIQTPNVKGNLPMIRVRNPWGDEHEWLGSFGDK